MDIESNRKAKKYSLKEQLLRVLWLLGCMLFRLSFRNMFLWRRIILKIFGSKIGKNVNIYNTVTITMPWNLEIGDYSSIGEHAVIYNLGKITIGKCVTVSQYSHLCAGTHDYSDPLLPLLKMPITINDEAWLCADSFVGPGVVVGEGAIVGARAVAMKNIEPWVVVAGNPAKYIKQRIVKT